MDYKILFEKTEMPSEAVELFYTLEEKKNADPALADEIAQILALHGTDVTACEKRATELSEKLEIAPCSFLLYVQLLLCEKAYNAYIKNGWDIEVFYDSMSDICIRIQRNYKRYKSQNVGIDNFLWLAGFIKLTRFKIGRLEYDIFEIIDGFEFELDGSKYAKGDKVIYMHIPGYLKFTKEACMDSYKRVRDFMEKNLGMDRNTPIITRTWMLHPFLKKVLVPDSALAGFQDDFTIQYVMDDDAPIEWVFGDKKDNIDDYPQETSLQRATVAHMKNGGAIGRAMGILKY